MPQTRSLLTVACLVAVVFLFNAAPSLAEGYKGLPWGASFEQFKELKAYSGSLPPPESNIGEHDIDIDSIAVAIGVPVQKFRYVGLNQVLVRANKDCLPKSFSVIKLKEDDVSYVFYNAKFAMVFFSVEAENFNTYKKDLTSKYGAAKTTSFDLREMAQERHKLTIASFKKGGTSAFLTKMRLDFEPSYSHTYVFVLYVGDALLGAIRKDIQRTKALLEKQEEAERNVGRRKDTSRMQ